MTFSQSDKDILSGAQYKAAKITLKTKVNVPKSSLLAELGWESINDFLDRQRVSYFKYICELPETRLCKVIFWELEKVASNDWPYFTYIKSIFQDVGLDFMFTDKAFNTGKFNLFMGQNSASKLTVDILSKSSLANYVYFYRRKGRQKYLDVQSDFEGARLKFLCRTNTLCLYENLQRFRLSNSSTCKICAENVTENINHFLLECPALPEIRKDTFENIDSNITDLNFNFLNPNDKIKFLIGDWGYFINDEIGSYFDNIGVYFIKSLFKQRSKILNEILNDIIV